MRVGPPRRREEELYPDRRGEVRVLAAHGDELVLCGWDRVGVVEARVGLLEYVKVGVKIELERSVRNMGAWVGVWRSELGF